MRRILQFIGTVVPLVLLLASARGADAYDPWLGQTATSGYEPGQIYLGVGATGGIYHLPQFEIFNVGPANFPPVNGRVSFDPDIFVIGPGMSVGYVFDRSTFPEWMGRSVRIEFAGTYWMGESTEQDNKFFRVNDVLPHIDGTSGAFGVASGFVSQLETDFHAFELAMRLSSDIAVRPNITLTPSVGIFGGHSREEYFMTYRVAPNLAASTGGFVDEQNSSRRLGGDVGLTVSWHPSEVATFFIGGRAGIFHIHTNLEGNDCRATGLVSGNQCGSVPSRFIKQTSVTDSASDIGFRGVLRGGVRLRTGWMTVSVGGFATYETAVPGIDNPTPNWIPAVGRGFTVTPPTPARVRYVGGHSFGGFIVVTIRLPVAS